MLMTRPASERLLRSCGPKMISRWCCTRLGANGVKAAVPERGRRWGHRDC